MSVSFDPFSPTWREDPYPKYRELRDRAPVHWSPEAGVWCVSRWEDVMFVLKSHEAFSSHAMMTQLMNGGLKGRPPVTARMLWFAARLLLTARLNPFAFSKVPSLIASDGERHDRLRAVVNRGFTPRQIAAWDRRAREIVGDCVGASLARLEAKVALEALVPELSRLRRAEARAPRIDSFLVRGPSRLALRTAA